MLSTEPVSCPWCASLITVLIDTSAGEQRYIEDCEVCCRPLSLTVRVGTDGEFVGVEAERED